MSIYNRMKSMSLVHELLYQSESLSVIRFKEYISALLIHLEEALSVSGVRIRLEADNVCMDINLAIPCGLVVNELVTNSVKHAFPSGEGWIEVSYSFDPKTRTSVLSVKDDGVGLPDTTAFVDSPKLGYKLVNALVSQLNGELGIRQDRGTSVYVTFVSDEVFLPKDSCP
jgi:two-component sensor histidine kinase